jgi:hypothetical protein
MAKDTGNALVTVENVTSDIHIDKNDLLAVAVSKAELHMQQQLANATREIRRLERALKDGTTGLKEKIAQLAAKLAKPGVKALEAAREACGSKARVETNWDMQQEKGTFEVTISIKSNDHYGSANFGTLKGAFDDAAQKLVAQLESDSQKLTDTRETAVDWRKKLAQIPTLERQYRARLAEATLSKTEKGQALLEALGGQFEQDVLALPGI